MTRVFVVAAGVRITSTDVCLVIVKIVVGRLIVDFCSAKGCIRQEITCSPAWHKFVIHFF